MIYLLDTNAISALMRAEPRMASWLSSIGADDRVAICTITRGEILFGLERRLQGAAEPSSKKRLRTCSPPCRVSQSRHPLVTDTRL